MKLIQRLLIVLLAFVMMLCFSTSAMAHGHVEHDKKLDNALFSLHEHDLKSGDSFDEAMTLLNYASYLSIDQHNSNQGDSDKLEQLRKAGVKDLPKSITDPSYKISEVGEKHRRFTHKGWDPSRVQTYNFEEEKVWTYRRTILLNTVDKIFDFKGDEKKKDSFCALVYYIHILGDREYDCQNNNYHEHSRIIMEVGGRSDKTDIIDELKYYLSILFKEQVEAKNKEDKENGDYYLIMERLDDINSDLTKIVRGNELKLKDSDSPEFNTYRKCVDNALNVLGANENDPERRANLPLLLKGETFFNEVFYKHPY